MDTNRLQDVFVHDWQTSQTLRVSTTEDSQEANGDSYQPVLSADGWMIAFASLASNLIPGDTNERLDVFVRDMQPLCLTDK